LHQVGISRHFVYEGNTRLVADSCSATHTQQPGPILNKENAAHTLKSFSYKISLTITLPSEPRFYQ